MTSDSIIILLITANALMILGLYGIATNKIKMTKAELAQALSDLGAQLTKALEEIRVAIENAGNTTLEIDAALAGAKEVAQSLDDLNPDAPPPEPPPEP
jgi:ABC-type transporter Mla subunit MlaD